MKKYTLIAAVVLLFSIGFVTIVRADADVVAPTVAISAPSSSATISGTYTLSATAADAVGVTKVEFFDGVTFFALNFSAINVAAAPTSSICALALENWSAVLAFR